jgi:hypothetical protein
MEKIQSLAVSNNTAGASIYELGQILESDSLGSLNNKLKEMDKRAQERAQMQAQQEQEVEQMKIQAKKDEMKMEQDHQAREKEKDRRARLLEAEIKSAGYGAMQDVNKNSQSDFMDVLDQVKASEEYQDTMNFKRESESNKATIANRKLDLEQEKVNVARQDSENKLMIAKENQTKSEIDAQKRNTKSK